MCQKYVRNTDSEDDTTDGKSGPSGADKIVLQVNERLVGETDVDWTHRLLRRMLMNNRLKGLNYLDIQGALEEAMGKPKGSLDEISGELLRATGQIVHEKQRGAGGAAT